MYELLGLEQGQHTLLVRAIDLAEIPNTDPTPASYTWTTLGEPDTTILSGPPDPTGAFSATFTFESNQPGATFQCSVNGSPWVPCTLAVHRRPAGRGRRARLRGPRRQPVHLHRR